MWRNFKYMFSEYIVILNIIKNPPNSWKTRPNSVHPPKPISLRTMQRQNHPIVRETAQSGNTDGCYASTITLALNDNLTCDKLSKTRSTYHCMNSSVAQAGSWYSMLKTYKHPKNRQGLCKPQVLKTKTTFPSMVKHPLCGSEKCAP